MDYAPGRECLADLPLPAAIVDLDALDRNADRLLQALPPPKTLRIASKSVRVPALLRHLLARDRMVGLMTYSAHETAWLAAQGFDDLLLAYPIARPDEAVALTRAATRSTLRSTVDHPDQVDLLSAAAEGAGVTLDLCIDVDVSWRPGGPVHLGVRRSPIRSPDAAVALARHIRSRPGVRLTAVLAYEAQVASLPDHVPGAAMRLAHRAIKAASIPLARARRAAVVQALRAEGFTIDLVNGGGTGSIPSTGRDPVCTEVTAGSGFVCSHLFDGFSQLDLEPALFFALAVCRRSDPDHITCAGGGYIASGATGPDRLPIVHAPEGLAPLSIEGFGEVQTPFRGPGVASLGIGDPVICRHAKAGELAERFGRYHLMRDRTVVQTVPTYRGEGLAFF